jgi:hypothetical protein
MKSQKMNDTLLKRLQDLPAFTFGHSRLQLECFQTLQQNGSPEWEYFQHIIQLRGLRDTIEEMTLSLEDLNWEIEDAKKWWPPWSLTKRKRTLRRLELKQKVLARNIKEKEREAEIHLEIIDQRYGPQQKALKTNSDLEKTEGEYWSKRLGRQLAVSHLARQLGVGEGEVAAVLSLPQEEQRRVLESMKTLLNKTVPLLKD